MSEFNFIALDPDRETADLYEKEPEWNGSCFVKGGTSQNCEGLRAANILARIKE